MSNRVCHFKLVLLGDTAVGKSCLVVRFVRDEFFEFQEPTIGDCSCNCGVSQLAGVSQSPWSLLVRTKLWKVPSIWVCGIKMLSANRGFYYLRNNYSQVLFEMSSTFNIISRIFDSNCRPRRRHREIWDLGHCRAREVPLPRTDVLPWSRLCNCCVWYH